MARTTLALILALSAVAAVAGCRHRPGPLGAEGGARRDAGPATPPPPFDVHDDRLDLVALQAVVGGAPVDLEVGRGPVRVPAGATAIRLETWERLADARLRLADAADHLLPYTLETGPVVSRRGAGGDRPGGTWFILTPARPFEAGARDRLELEGERGPKVTDAAGKTYRDLDLVLETVAGPAADGGAR